MIERPETKPRKRIIGCALLLLLALDALAETRSELGAMVEMRDGVRLLTDVYLPAGDGPFPVILCRVPYGTRSDYVFQPAVGEYFASRGYAYVTQNVRGKFGSEGLFTAYGGGAEIPDAYDTIDWVVAQDWSNGDVGVMGESYYGYTTLMAAVGGHPAVKAISPANITLAREKQSLDGAFPLQASGMWTLDMDDAENGEYQDTAQIDLEHLPLITMGKRYELRDYLWQEMIRGYSEDPRGKLASAAEYYKKITVPTLHFGGWYDSFTRGTLAVWNGVRQSSDSEAARSQQWLIMGPWDHDSMSGHLSGENPPTNIGRREIGDGAVAVYGETLVAFFDHFLQGKQNGFADRPRVRYFNIGDNEWRDADEWPPKQHSIRYLYLQAEGRLSSNVPAAESLDTYIYDPADPVSITAGTNDWGRAAGLPDRQQILDRPDVLIYETAALEDDLDISGPILLELYAATTAKNTDFTGALVDVYPDGYSLLIQEGILRASFRNVDEAPSNLEPGTVYKLTIDLWATSYTVPKGHTIRLEISSSNFPRFARNLNNGEAFGMSDRIEVATQTVHHSAKYPSRLVLPVMP
jgi:hypothetical protein